MLYTYIHHKEYKDASWDVAHLYEHLVTRSFQSHLESLGIHPGLIGSVSGDTFEHVIFLQAIFYDKQVAEAYKHFLEMPSLTDSSFIPQMLLEIEIENKEHLNMKDKSELESQLGSLSATPWMNNAAITNRIVDESTTLPDAPFVIKRSAKDFRDIVVSTYAKSDDLDENEQILFLRLSVIIGDIIGYTIRKELPGAYHVGLSPISKVNANMGSAQHIRFPRNVTLRQIQETAEQALLDINVQQAMPLISAQLDEFADRATWRNIVVDYYRHTGVLTNNNHISSLATPERIASIISKLKVYVHTMNKGEEAWFS